MSFAPRNNGSSAAALLATGIACASLGLVTILAEANPAIDGFLNWYKPVGSLSGETGIALAAWLLLWIFLHSMWKKKHLKSFGPILRLSWVLIFLGFLGTFPPFFELFAEH